MNKVLMAGAALLSFSTAGVAMAQDMAAPAGQPPADTMATPGNPAPGATPADPGMSMPGAPPPASDPNAGQPTGAVPADPGMAPAPADAPRDPAAPMGSSANPVTMGGNMTPPPTDMKDYPVCSKSVQDSCVNPGDARKMRKRR